MNAPLEPAHSKFGGSVATRILRCPASVGLVERVPERLRKSSAYANRGSALHIATARLIEREVSLDDLAGQTTNDYVVTHDDVENALRPVLTYVETLLDQPGAEYFLECRVAFPTVAGAFGTLDLTIRIGDTVYIVDHKFGVGIKVLALYPDGDADIINGQLLFYAAAARHSIPEFFAGVDNIVLMILQPMSTEVDAEMVSSVAVTHAEIDAFIALFCTACEEALAPSPRLEKGSHCRFCPARPVCPEHTKPLLDLARFMVPTPAAAPSKEAYLQLLADGLNLVDAIKDVRTALHDQAKRALENGDLVPGYALSAGRAVRNWKNETAAVPDLLKLGLARDDVLVEVLRSPKQVELRAKARGIKIPSELIVSTRSGTSLTRAENAHVPILGRNELARAFSEALENFTGEKSNDYTEPQS